MRSETVKALKAHISINVRNVAESVEFYKKMLGLEPSKVTKPESGLSNLSITLT